MRRALLTAVVFAAASPVVAQGPHPHARPHPPAHIGGQPGVRPHPVGYGGVIGRPAIVAGYGRGFGPPPYQPPVVYPLFPQNPEGRPAPSPSAALTIVLPTAGVVWADGEQRPGPRTEFALTSPAVPAGEEYTFAVRAEWMGAGGARYRVDRNVSVPSGSRQRLTLVRGDPVSPGD